MTEASASPIEVVLARIEPGHAGLYVLQIQSPLEKADLIEFMRHLNTLMTATGIDDVPVLVLNGDRKLNILDDDGLKQLGLRRIHNPSGGQHT